MWFVVLMLIFVLAITLRQATSGLFSAMIMTVLTVCCAAVALGTYEWAATSFVAEFWKREYAYPVALGAIFGVSLGVLRLLFDKLITRSCLLPVFVDRFGGGLFGFVTALTTVGVLAICLAMIPFGRSMLGFTRVPNFARVADGPSPADESAVGDSLWLAPDRFASGVAALCSAGIFSGKESFYLHDPDLIQSLAWVGSVPAEVSRYTAPGSISVEGTDQLQFVYRMNPANEREGRTTTYEPIEPQRGHEFRMVQVRLMQGARDERKSLVFTARQLRLVGRLRDGGLLKQFHAIAIQQADVNDPINRHVKYVRDGSSDRPIIDDVFSPRDQRAPIEVVFSVPRGFTPDFVEYKRGARAPVHFEKSARPSVPPPVTGTASGAPGSTAPQPAPARPAPAAPVTQVADNQNAVQTTRDEAGSGRRSNRRSRRSRANIQRVATTGGQSLFGDQMPIELRAYRKLKNAELTRDKLTSGHLIGEVDQQSGGSNPPVTRFDVPADKRLLQLDTSFLQARSGFGRAISAAVGTVQNYFVTDSSGKQYKLAGEYATADVNGKKLIEVQYFRSPVGSIGGIGKFDRIKDSDLTGDYKLVMLFLVDPGVTITAFSTGGAATAAEDLTAQKLVAPE